MLESMNVPTVMMNFGDRLGHICNQCVHYFLLCHRANASTVSKEFTTAQGKKCYYNKDTKQFKWTIPDELKGAASRESIKAALELHHLQVKFSGISWTNDGKGFLYSRYPDPKYPTGFKSRISYQRPTVVPGGDFAKTKHVKVWKKVNSACDDLEKDYEEVGQDA
ncbi:pre-mRNA-processing protein 40A [Artemisia annua]|uniref:Pre-mRNA-processing protein 40A n=1 Tax=Artemisia annua TaxID=35608 RepID=A0A2U1KWW7_ARTAN|nr:pre-mRNA-processing protein 40A [Artemisia annua]